MLLPSRDTNIEDYNDTREPVSGYSYIQIYSTHVTSCSWRQVKRDFLHHFHRPWLDLLLWILVEKLAPIYYRKLDRMLNDKGQYCELPIWCKAFKREWKKLTKTPITGTEINLKYQPDTMKWVLLAPTSLLADSCSVNISSNLYHLCPLLSSSRSSGTKPHLSGSIPYSNLTLRLL